MNMAWRRRLRDDGLIFCGPQPLLRLRAQNHRVFFRDQGGSLEISRVLDRKQAYR